MMILSLGNALEYKIWYDRFGKGKRIERKIPNYPGPAHDTINIKSNVRPIIFMNIIVIDW